ncbi:amidohydrolase family protein [Variovorax sp. VNK109]|uniref:amidohydrolase family protein n=1 Tax=Variovorax sp. VNK109 TaxID=3400919 RepID=UPI003C02BF9F
MTTTSAPQKLLTDPPDPNPRKPALVLPPGSWDCLIHVYGPMEDYPFHPGCPYRSAPVLPETFIRQMKILGLEKAVIANGAGYGSDSRYLLETLEKYPKTFRGVTYVDDDVSPARLNELRRKGVLGARFAGGPAYPHLPKITQQMARRLADADMHVEFLTFTPGGMAEEKELFLSLPNDRIVIDHFGRLDATKGLDQPGFTALLELLDTGRVWLKMSNPAFCTKEDYPYAPVLPFARTLVRHAPERLLWGSNWPHVMRNGRIMPNDGDLIDLIGEWIPSEEDRLRIMSVNPDMVYGDGR